MDLETLVKLRSQLETSYYDWFSLIESRKLLVKDIIAFKSNFFHESAFDLKRESDLFSSLESSLIKLTLEEVLSLSLLIESQVLSMGGKNYPQWSNHEHIEKKNLELELGLEHLCNPVLLAAWKNSIFKEQVLPFLSYSWKNKLQHLCN